MISWFILLVCGLRLPCEADLTGELGVFEDQCLALNDQGRPNAGKEIALQFVARAVALHGENHDATATAVHWLARFTQESGDFDGAEKLWFRALAIDEALHGRDSEETARRLSMLGGHFRERGEFDRARAFFTRALEIRTLYLGADHILTANVLNDLGRLAMQTGDLAQAEDFFRRALPAFERARGQPRGAVSEARAWTDLSRIHSWMGDLERAQQDLHRAIQVAETHPVEGRAVLFWAALGLVELQRAGTPSKESTEELERTLIALSQGFEPGRRSEREDEFEAVLIQLAGLYVDRGDMSAAWDVVEPLVAAASSTQAPPSWERDVSTLVSLADVAGRDGHYIEAERLALRACARMESLPGVAPSQLAWALGILARTYDATGRPAAALALADRLQSAEERELEALFAFTTERQRLIALDAFMSNRGSPWAELGAVEPLARTVLRTKGVVLDSLIEDRLLVAKASDPDTQDLVSRVRRARQRMAGLQSAIAAASGSNQQASLNTNLTQAWQGWNDSEVALARRIGGMGRARKALGVTLDEVSRAIPERAVVIEFLRFFQTEALRHEQGHYGALALFGDQAPRWIPLGATEDLDRVIALYQHGIRNVGEDGTLLSSLRELSTRLWLPIEKVLPPGTTTVIFSPDGQLNLVSFAALLLPNGRFLGEQFEIGYVSSARDLLDVSSGSAGPATFALWADPDFRANAAPKGETPRAPLMASRTVDVPGLRSLCFDRLQGAEREARLLSTEAPNLGFARVDLHLDAEASEARLRAVHSPRVLHLATHGFVLPKPADDRTSGVRLPDNPMLRSGILLAGAQRTMEEWSRGKAPPPDTDGIVTAEEMALLDLQDTWLVVVSACDTGGGEARVGEGILGLRRGILQAGAKNLLVALWALDDGHTPDFMLDFYRAAHELGSARRGLARTQGQWLTRLRQREGVARACRLAGPFILSFRGGIQDALHAGGLLGHPP